MTHHQTITVYLGSSDHCRDVFKRATERLGHIIGDQKRRLVYGGMDAGLMGRLAVNALQSGAHVTGIIPQKLKDSERILRNLSESILVGDLWERKKMMFQRADAVIALPGGFGTADESLEMLYWDYLGLHTKPIVFVNIEGYWDSLLNYLRPLPDFDGKNMIVVNDVDDIFPTLDQWHTTDTITASDRYPHFEDEISRHTNEPVLIDRANLQNSYYAICALGLKQLAKHNRPMGFLNEGGQFNDLLAWFARAEAEHFITPKCLKLFSVADTREGLMELLNHQPNITIDLHKEKWGERRASERD